MSVAVLIVAAGRGARMEAETPKQYLALGGVAVLRRTAEAFLRHPDITMVQVVWNPDDKALYETAMQGLALPAPVKGGNSRQESVALGLEALSTQSPDKILIHDAARPFVSNSEISNVLAALETNEGALSALPVVDSVKRANDQGQLQKTEDRQGLWRALTPQGFDFQAILQAHQQFAGQNLTDDAAVAEAAGLSVQMVPGSNENFKITSQADLERAKAMIQQELQDLRVGQGLDAHRFSEQAPEDGQIMLAGVPLAHEVALAGHSDADVALHALTDALLGALVEGDIGEHFPPGDDQWKGAASDIFLAFARDRVTARGGIINHVDLTIVCERPKIGPHRSAMQVRISEILAISADRVSIKATTTEQMGFTGRGEGIAAQATVTIRLPG